MKRPALALYVLFLGFVLSFYGCQKKSVGPQGQLMGVEERPEWNNINPYGLVYIPSGTFRAGPSDQEMNDVMVQRPRSKSIQGFYMDDTEVTNNEYRQFVFYVRDSMAHTLLSHFQDDSGGVQKIDWTQPLDYSPDSEDAGALGALYYSGDDQFWGRKEMDSRKLVYKYEWYDWKTAASASSTKAKKDQNTSRSKFIVKEEVPIYPDTLCWTHDFAYSYNEPMTRNYFSHPAFDDYPTVGVNWVQAKAFCAWRTKFWEDYTNENGETMGEVFRLPFEHEWEYASRGGMENAPYPWGGPYTRNGKGCLLANFKPGRGNYPEDGGLYTVRADSYHPNDFGLYNMSGNVAEWTSTAYFENASSFEHDLNSDIEYNAKAEDPVTMKRKVLRGGSWKDIAYYLQTGTRAWEYQDTAKSYIGFRCALTFLGRSIDDDYGK